MSMRNQRGSNGRHSRAASRGVIAVLLLLGGSGCAKTNDPWQSHDFDTTGESPVDPIFVRPVLKIRNAEATGLLKDVSFVQLDASQSYRLSGAAARSRNTESYLVRGIYTVGTTGGNGERGSYHVASLPNGDVNVEYDTTSAVASTGRWPLVVDLPRPPHEIFVTVFRGGSRVSRWDIPLAE